MLTAERLMNVIFRKEKDLGMTVVFDARKKPPHQEIAKALLMLQVCVCVCVCVCETNTGDYYKVDPGIWIPFNVAVAINWVPATGILDGGFHIIEVPKADIL